MKTICKWIFSIVISISFLPVHSQINRSGDEEFVSFKIYPNPATDIVTIDLPANWQKKNLKFEIFNLNGQVLNNLQTTIYKENVRLDLGKLPKGIYFVKLSCEGQTGLRKIVKQ